MKKATISIVALLFGAISAFAAGAIDPSLIGHYKLDGNALDSTANAYNGTIYSAASSANGVDNGCYDFNGVNTAIVVPDPAAENRFPAGGAITISSWVKVRAYHSDETVIAAMDSGRHIRTRASIRLDATGKFYYYANTSAGVRTLYGPVVETNTWCHVAATQDSANTKLFINGIKVAEANDFAGLVGPWPASNFNYRSLPFEDISVSFAIGSWTDYLRINSVIFNGLIDDVRFYNRALSDSEMAELYTAFVDVPAPTSAGLVLWNRLGSADEVGNSEVGDNGILNSGTFVPGPFGSAIELNLQQQYGVVFPIEPLATFEGCVEFWARVSDFPNMIPPGASPGLLGWFDESVRDGYLLFFARNDGNGSGGLTARTGLGYVGTGAWGSWSYSNAIRGGDVSQWHHYAMSWSTYGIPDAGGKNNKVVLFVDGKAISASGLAVRNSPLITSSATRFFGLFNCEFLSSGRVAFDNLKVWNFGKSDFSDRFAEDAGAPPTLPEEDNLDAGLQLYYPFSSNEVSVVTDASGNGHNGSTIGAQWRDGGPNGGYLCLNGKLHFVNAGNAVNFPSWEKYTVSVWFLNDGGGDNSGYGQKVFDKSSFGHDTYLSSVPDNYNPGGWLTYYCNEGGAVGGVNARDVNVRTDNSWHHFVVVRDGANCSSWLDGELQSSITNMISVNNNAPLYIGYSASLDHYQRRAWSGFIDEFRVYDRAISSNEVSMLFQAAVVLPVTRTLVVQGARGAATPANGDYPYAEYSEVSAISPSFVVEGTTRYLCAGATVDGNAFAQISTNQVTLSITNDVTLTWNWLTQYKLETAVIGSGEVTLAEMWQDAGAVVQLTATPASEWVFSGWDGDLEGCVLDGAAISVPMDQPRLVRATFVPLVVMAIKDYAKRPGNAPLKYRGTPKAWFYSNEVGGLYCNSPLPNRSSTMQLTAKGPGVLSFEWEFPGADGASTLTCSVGTTVRATKQGEIAETASVAIASGSSSTVRWKLRRAANSAEVGAVIRNIVWTPLAQPSLPVPADGSVLLERDFAGVSWTGSAEHYRLYAGTSKSLQRIGTEEYNENSAPAAAFEAAMAQANGDPLFWRVDAVAVDSFGTEIVNRGALWSLTLLPDGSPEFESSLPHISAGLKRGVFSEVGPLSFANGFEGDPQCRIIAGRLPAGMRLAVRDNAVYIAGVPTRAGQYASTLQLSVKTSGRISRQGTTRGVDLTVSDLGEVIGKYDGWLSDSIYGEGPVSLTVSAAGRISGKFTLNGVAHTLRASAFDRVTNGWCVVSTEVTSRSKGSFPVTFAVSEEGWVEAFCNDDSQALLALVRNRWREAGSREILAAHAGDYHLGLPASVAYPEGGGLISISISEKKKGRVLIKGTMPNGKRFPITAALMHLPGTDTEPARVMVVISAKPSSATAGQGLFGVQEIVTDPARVEPNAILDLLPLRWW